MYESFVIFNISMWFRCDGKFGKFGGVGGTKHSPDEFVDDHRRMSREYDEFKVRLDALFTKIPERSDAYNAEVKEGAKATWMADV